MDKSFVLGLIHNMSKYMKLILISLDAFANLVDFYEIDVKWFNMKTELRKDQLKSNLSYRERRMMEMQR